MLRHYYPVCDYSSSSNVACSAKGGADQWKSQSTSWGPKGCVHHITCKGNCKVRTWIDMRVEDRICFSLDGQGHCLQIPRFLVALQLNPTYPAVGYEKDRGDQWIHKSVTKENRQQRLIIQTRCVPIEAALKCEIASVATRSYCARISSKEVIKTSSDRVR
jgi:hypothetical protein